MFFGNLEIRAYVLSPFNHRYVEHTYHEPIPLEIVLPIRVTYALLHVTINRNNL